MILAGALDAHELVPASVDATAQADSAEPSDTLPPLVVTARKWEEVPAELPQSLSVLDAEILHERGIESVRDASFHVPNLFLNEFSSRRLSFPTLRGIGSGQGDPAVTTYIDGVPQLTTSSTNVAFFDIERVEFLRGPQSTLYGRNALGGIVHVIPRQPSATREIEGGVSFGNYGLRELRAVGGGALLGEELMFRVALLDSSRDGYTENDLTGHDVDFRDALSMRGSLLWAPTDADWDLRFALHTERARDGGFVLSDLQGLRDRPHHINQDYEGRTQRDIFAPALTWTWYGEEWELTSVTAWQDWDIDSTADFDFSAFDMVRRDSVESQSYFNQELRVSSVETEEGPRWLAGVNLFLADSERIGATEYRPIVVPPLIPGIDTTSGEFDDWGAALFAQTTFNAFEEVDLGIGLRFDRESKEAKLRRTFVQGGITLSDVRTRLDEDYDEFVPRVSLSRPLNENVRVYGLVAKGFKAGGFNMAAPTGRLAFGPETSWTYELGAKSSWFDERLNLNLAAFTIDWDDMQLSLFDAATGGFVDNAGEATSRGLELELQARPAPYLELSGTLGLTDAEFDEFVDPYGADVSGNTLAFAPRSTWSLGATLSGDDEESSWFVRGELAGVGTFYYDAGNRERESFTLLNLRGGYELGRWRLEAWVKNALDDEYVQIAFQPDPSNPNTFVGENGAPVTAGISLSAGI